MITQTDAEMKTNADWVRCPTGAWPVKNTEVASPTALTKLNMVCVGNNRRNNES